MKFHVEINGGKEQTIEVLTTQYHLAALAALALIEYDPQPDYDVVKIWVPRLMPDYGPYFYAFNGYAQGTPEKNREW